MSELEQAFLWALGVVGALVVWRWRYRAFVMAVGLVVWTAFGARACAVVITVGLLGPVVRRVRRDGVMVGRRYR